MLKEEKELQKVYKKMQRYNHIKIFYDSFREVSFLLMFFILWNTTSNMSREGKIVCMVVGLAAALFLIIGSTAAMKYRDIKDKHEEASNAWILTLNEVTKPAQYVFTSCAGSHEHKMYWAYSLVGPLYTSKSVRGAIHTSIGAPTVTYREVTTNTYGVEVGFYDVEFDIPANYHVGNIKTDTETSVIE